MLTEIEKYRLSLYQTCEVMRKTDECLIEKVYCTLDENSYIKRSCPDDRREVFTRLKSLQSPRIPQVFEVFFSDGVTIVIEQYIAGVTLTKWLAGNRITSRQAEAFAVQLLEALAILHEHGIIHRDVKPDNIMIGENGNVFLIDYGIARIYQKEAGQDTQTLGTIGFAAPEQYGFSQSDFRSDLYALGVTLTVLAEASGGRGPISRVAARCSRFDPESRYPTAKAALRALKGKQLFRRMTAGVTLVGVMAALLLLSADLKERQIPFTAPSQGAESLPEKPVSADGPASLDGSESRTLNGQWIPIIEYDTGNSLSCLRIPSGSNGEEQLLMPGTEISYEMAQGVLTLCLAGQTFVFSHSPQEPPDYEDTCVDGEIMLYDMDGDGQDELLVALSDRLILEGVNGSFVCNTNWRTVWCVGFTEDEGFWRADGELITHTNHGTIKLNLLGVRELYAEDTMSAMILSGRELIWMN